MKKNFLNLHKIGLVTMFFLLTMTGCSSLKYIATNIKNVENNEKNLDEKVEEIHTIDPSATMIPQRDSGTSISFVKMKEEFGLYEVIRQKRIEDALLCQVDNVTWYSNIKESGLADKLLNAKDMPDAVDSSWIDGDGNVKEGLQFFTIDLTLRNRAADVDQNITRFRMLYSEGDIDERERKEEILYYDYYFPIYFSESIKSEKGVYDFEIAVGDTKHLTVGWCIDTTVYEPSKLILELQRYGIDENHEEVIYFKVGEEDV